MATNEEVVRNVDAEAYDPDKPQQYGEAFPPLTSAPHFGAGPKLAHPAVAMEKTIWSNKMTMKTSTCTQVFTVPMEERRYKEFNEQSFGDETDQAKICKEIMARNNVSIEMSCAKDQSLTVVIHGKDQNVMKARREIVGRLQTQANTLLKIPREHHRFILGKSGKKLQELELATQTKITIPRPEENSDMIKITGTKEGIDKAKHEIQITSDEQAKLAFERLPVPKVYHPFICGPKNDNIRKWVEETGAKIHMPPPSVMKDEIVVSGEVDGVLKCKANIMKIYEEKPSTLFLTDVRITDGTGKGIYDAIMTHLQNRGISAKKIMGLGTDGASTMTGKKDGLTGQFLRTNPHLRNTHCSAHRLALCSEQAAKKVPAITEFQQTLEMIFYHFKKSPSKCDKMEAVQKLLDQPTVKYREVHQVRWLSFYEALDAVNRTLDSLLTYLSTMSEKDPKAIGLRKKVEKETFISLSYAMLDILAPVMELSLVFQKEDLDIGVVKF